MKSPYELDDALGLRYFITDTTGVGGRLRDRIEDFVVDELPRDVPCSKGGDYLHFTLEKRDMETISAVRKIARCLHVSFKRFGYAGNKDKRAVTRQRVSVWRVKHEDLESIRIHGLRLFDFMNADSRIYLGDSKGNCFLISVRNVAIPGQEAEALVRTTIGQARITGVPNYYGYQRFGTIRPNTHLVGRKLVKSAIEAAVLTYLGTCYSAEREDARQARQYLEETRDYRGALRLCPKRLTYERTMLDALAKNPADFAGAIRRIPKRLARLFVHAYQAYLFNTLLSAMIESGMQIRGCEVPLVGFRTKVHNDRQGELLRLLLDEENIAPKDFYISAIPELSSEGEMRAASLDVSPQFSTHLEDSNDSVMTFKFMLPPGSYATVVLREFMKSDPLAY